MSQEIPAFPASVNTKWVGKWDKEDVLKWIKVHQDRAAFEGKKETQFNASQCN